MKNNTRAKHSGRIRPKPFNKLFITIIFISAILLIGYNLRHYNYLTIPRHGATFDEFAWAWLGINLIQKGTPISWSPHPQYENRTHLIYQGAAFWIVKPYLEHPPLFGLIVGSFALLRGSENMYDIALIDIRPLSLLMGTASILLIYLLVSELYDNKTAVLSALLYATMPTLVIGSRLVQNENFLIPVWLLTLYLLSLYLKSDIKLYRNTAAIFSGIVALAKVPWLVVGLSIMMILSYKKKWKDVLIFGIVLFISVLIYIIYGSYYDKELFIDLMRLQTARYDISYQGFFSIFRNPLLVDWAYLDGWIFVGWFTIFLLLKDIKKNIFVIVPFIAYLGIYVFAIPDEPGHGWYRFPFLPFLTVSSAIFIFEEYKQISIQFIIFMFMVGLALLQNAGQEQFGFSYIVYRFYILFSVIPVLFFIWFAKYRRFSRYYVIFTISVFIILNVLAILSARA